MRYTSANSWQFISERTASFNFNNDIVPDVTKTKKFLSNGQGRLNIEVKDIGEERLEVHFSKHTLDTDGLPKTNYLFIKIFKYTPAS